MRFRDRRRAGAALGLGRAAVLLAAAFLLGACAAPMGGDASQGEAPKTPVVLRSVARSVLFVPVTEWVYLWDRPGGPSARAMRVAKVPSGTEALMVESEPARPSSDIWDVLLLDNPGRQPVQWVKVVTPSGEGWVRKEFVEPR